MIYSDERELTGRYYNGHAAIAVYKGLQLVWTAFTSLSAWFRSEGYFRSEPW